MRIWIEEVLKEKIDPKVELSAALQNGVLVCRLMLAIKEGSIPKIHTNTTLQFKIRENIMFFLQACEDIGIPRYKIFAIPDMIENKNFFKVLECLEELAVLAAHDKMITIPLKPVNNGIIHNFIIYFLNFTLFLFHTILFCMEHPQTLFES